MYFYSIMIYRGRFVIPILGDAIEDGAISVCNGEICRVGEFRDMRRHKDEEVRDCRPLILMPGLINCHTHLEEGVLRSQMDTPNSFTAWYTRAFKYLSQADIVKRISAVRLGCRESLFYGTTTIVDTAATGASFLVLREEQIQSFILMQFKGLVPWHAKAVFKEIENRMELLDEVFPFKQTGLSPEAPYSASIELYRLAIKTAKKKNMLFQTHLAESNEELEMFSSHTGPLFEYSRRQHDFDLHKYTKGAANFMLRNNLIPTNSLVIHGNYLSSEEIEAMVNRKVFLIHCARSHEFFGHKDFPFPTALSRGLNICLGTEGLGSNPNLNLFDEMYSIKRRHADIDSKIILEFATVNAARALKAEGQIGALAPGYDADIIGIRLPYQSADNLYDEILKGDPQVELVVIKGEEVIS